MIQIKRSIPTLYKYCDPAIAALIVRRGSLRIGTLAEYRLLEGKDVRGDSAEGTRGVTSAPGPTTYREGSHVHRWLKSKGIQVEGNISTSGSNAVVIEQRFQNCFIFCASTVCSRQLAEKFGGTCIEITNALSFLVALDDAFRAYLKPLGVVIREAVFDQCLYVNRRQPYYKPHPKHPYFTKSPSFEDEAECRVVWIVDSGSVEPVILNVSAALPLLHVKETTGL